MDTQSPDTQPHAAQSTKATLRPQLLWALSPLLAVLIGSYFLFLASPLLLLLVGAIALGWLIWVMSGAMLSHAEPAWLRPAVAGGVWLVYAMRLVYGWRQEMAYLGSLWHVFGWTFLSTLFWGFVLAWALRLLDKSLKA
jgi:hypothetical protein